LNWIDFIGATMPQAEVRQSFKEWTATAAAEALVNIAQRSWRSSGQLI